MVSEKATYSNSAINEAIRRVKAINWTVSRKNHHFAKATELKAVFEYCNNNINRWLFDPDFWPMRDYFRAAYDYKQYTKKELDSLENSVKRFLQSELTSIHNMMITGEVNTTD